MLTEEVRLYLNSLTLSVIPASSNILIASESLYEVLTIGISASMISCIFAFTSLTNLSSTHTEPSTVQNIPFPIEYSALTLSILLLPYKSEMALNITIIIVRLNTLYPAFSEIVTNLTSTSDEIHLLSSVYLPSTSAIIIVES